MKLVRDGSKEHVEKHDPKVVFRQRTEKERLNLLFAKLLEEAGEFLAAEDREQKLKELGDLTEIIWALAEMNDIPPVEVTAQAVSKQMLRGKFESLWAMEIELDSDRPRQSAPEPEPPRYTPPRYYEHDGHFGVGYSG